MCMQKKNRPGGDPEEGREIGTRKKKQAERGGRTGKGRQRLEDLAVLSETSGYPSGNVLFRTMVLNLGSEDPFTAL